VAEVSMASAQASAPRPVQTVLAVASFAAMPLGGARRRKC